MLSFSSVRNSSDEFVPANGPVRAIYGDGGFTKMDSPASDGAPVSNWWLRTFDPHGVEMKYNSYEASLNRKFQEAMSNTAYQRAVLDMQKAGLNPYALYSSASSASVPAGVSAHTTGGSNASVLGTIAQVAGLAVNAFALGAKVSAVRGLTNAWNNRTRIGFY